MLRFLKNKQGFTLIELVIIIILLGVLAAIAIPRYVDLRNQAIRASAQATLDAGRAAVQLDFADQILNDGKYVYTIGAGTTAGNVFAGTDVTALEAELASSPNYPPVGAYNNPPQTAAAASEGFQWYLVTAGSATAPVQPPVIDAAIDTNCNATDAFGGLNDRCKVSRL